MKRYLFAVGAVLATVLGLATGPSAARSPRICRRKAGLNVPTAATTRSRTGKFSIELDITSKGITLKLGVAQAEPAAPMMIDALLPAYVEQCLQHLRDVAARPERFVHVDAVRNSLWRLYVAYFPDRQAKADDVSEEQGDPNRRADPEQVFRDMHSRSVPLGLIEVSY